MTLSGYYASLLIQQYQKPKARSTVESIADGFEFLVLKVLEKMLNIDDCSGNLLDLIGNLMGISRLAPIVDSRPRFILGQSQLGSQDLLGQSNKTAGFEQLDDSDYRKLLKAFKIRNSVQPTPLNLKAFSGILDYTVEEKLPAKIQVSIMSDERIAALIATYDLFPRPSGVYIEGYLSSSGTPFTLGQSQLGSNATLTGRIF